MESNAEGNIHLEGSPREGTQKPGQRNQNMSQFKIKNLLGKRKMVLMYHRVLLCMKRVASLTQSRY